MHQVLCIDDLIPPNHGTSILRNLMPAASVEQVLKNNHARVLSATRNAHIVSEPISIPYPYHPLYSPSDQVLLHKQLVQ